MNEGSGIALTHLEDQVSVYRSVTRRTFFRNAENPMIRRDQHTFIWRDKTPANHAARLGDFRCDCYIDVSLRRKQRHDRRRFIVLSGYKLEVVNRSACPLCHPCKRRALTPPSAVLRRRDEPVSQHATALSPECSDHHIDGGVLSRHQNCRCAKRFRSRIRHHSLTRTRVVSSKRSHALGLWIISTLEKEGHNTAECALVPHTPQPTQLLST